MNHVPPSIWTDDPEKAKAEGREIRPSHPDTFLQGDGHLIAETPAWLLEVITEKKPFGRLPVHRTGP
jgi:hypothetical protein